MHARPVGLHAMPVLLPRSRATRWRVPVIALSVLPLSWLAVTFATFGGDVALWWPAAGAGVLASAATRGDRRLLTSAAVGVLSGTGQLLAGRDLEASLYLAAANGVEALIGGAVLAYGVSGWPRLRDLEDLARLLAAALASAVTISLLVATIAQQVYGDPWGATTAAIFASHLAAILIVSPLGMRLERTAHRAGMVETWMQSLLLLAVTVAVFAPSQDLPLAFLLFPAIAWGGLRLAPRLVVLQMFLTSLVVTSITLAGWGMFANTGGPEGQLTGALVQSLLMTLAAVALPLMVLRGRTARAEDALTSSDDMLENIMSATTATGVLGTALDGSIEFFNVGAEEMTGWTTEEAVGKAALAVLPRDDGKRLVTVATNGTYGREPLRDLVRPLRDGAHEQSFSHDWSFLRKDGDLRTLSIRVSKRYRDGELVGYLGVAHDVTERRRQEELTATALEHEREVVERLEQVDRAKNDFMASVSHELRTPITSILGYTELLMSDENGALPTMHRQILSRVERNGRRLIGLVEDVLTMSEIEVGNLRFRFTDVDVRDVLLRAVETEVSVFGIAGVLLKQDVADNPLPATADSDKLERAIAALLDNAAKYSDAGSSVTVSLQPDGAGNAVLAVTDLGTGIRPEDVPRIFDRFFRSREANARAIQGAGLGLTVARSIIDGHQGTIRCDSEVGRGTTMTLVLPLATPPVEPADPSVPRSGVGNDPEKLKT